jgi:hypothetical protein
MVGGQAAKGRQMRNRSMLVLAGFAVALAFGAFVSASSANRLAVSGRQWRATWNALKYIGFTTFECHVTLEGSFHSRTMSKALEALVGYVTRVTVDSTNCTNGSARALTETLPWHVRYGGFEGTLPIITGISMRIVGFAYLFQVAGIAPAKCLFRSSVTSPMKGIVNRNTATGVASSLRVEEPSGIPFTSGTSTFACGNTIRFGGTSNGLSEGPTSTSIIVTLVQ